jgi:Flp pilus assembly protein CpaB
MKRSALMSENPDRKMLDDLKHSVPVARPAFQYYLEKRLLTHLQDKEKTAMTTLTLPARRPNTYRPLVAAAALVIVLASVLLWQGGKPPAPGYETLLERTSTPTMPFSPCESFLQRGQLLEAEKACQEAVTTQPDDANAWARLGRVEYLRRNYEGAIASFGQCIKLASESVDCNLLRGLAHYYLGYCYDAWTGLVDTFNILQRAGNQEGKFAEIQEGFRLLKLNCPAYADVQLPYQGGDIVLEGQVYSPVVIFEKAMSKGSTIHSSDVIKVLWPQTNVPLDAINDVKRLENHVLQRDVAQWQPILDSDLQLQLPDGTIAVTIPIQQLDSVPEGIVEGDRVDVWASFLFVNVEGAMGTPGPLLINPQGTLIPQTVIPFPTDVQFQMPVTVIPGNALHSTPQRTTQVIVHDALVVQVSKLCGQGDACDDVMVLAVTPQEADMLLWIINARLPLRLVKVGGK